MTIEEMKEKKREHGYTYNMMSQMSGVPLGTVQKIFTGETKSPRYDTLEALARIFENGDRDYLYADMVEDSGTAYAAKVQGQYTLDDYYALPEDRRVELIDGCIYDMAAPSTIHQLIAGEVHRQISNFILEHDGPCMPFISPVDVQLDCDDKTMHIWCAGLCAGGNLKIHPASRLWKEAFQIHGCRCEGILDCGPIPEAHYGV